MSTGVLGVGKGEECNQNNGGVGITLQVNNGRCTVGIRRIRQIHEEGKIE